MCISWINRGFNAQLKLEDIRDTIYRPSMNLLRMSVVPDEALAIHAWAGPDGSRKLRFPEFLYSRHLKVVRLSVLSIGRLYTQETSPVLIYVRGWVDPRAKVAAGRIKSMKNPNNPIGNRTCDLPIYSAVPQPTASPCTPVCDKDCYIQSSENLDT